MTLIAVLIALALEHFVISLDHIRGFGWFDRYTRWLELKFEGKAFWGGPLGVIATLLVPLLVLILAAKLLGQVSPVLVFILAIAVFVYCLGPDLNTWLSRYIDSLESRDEATRAEMEQALGGGDESSGRMDKNRIISRVLLRSHEHFFGILFWFIVLGMAGALLYRLVIQLYDNYGDIHGGYAESVRTLHGIMMWPSAHLLALGFGLSGSLVHAFEAWRGVEGEPLECCEDVIVSSGYGALQYEVEEDGDTDDWHDVYINWLGETRGLLNRTLIVWLTVLGIMTIGGYLV
ncbi:MAG: hypothetical protein WD750_12155 [Gammaproteobacteria bacterium]